MNAVRANSVVFLAMAAVMGLVLALRGQAAIDLDGAVAIWLFNEGDGDEVTDASGNANEGAFVNDVKWAKGKFGGALELDGVSAYVEINNPVVTETEDFTMGCWVKPGDEQKQYANILSSHQEPPQHGMSFEQDSLTHNLYYLIGGDGGVWMGWVKGNLKTQLAADEWQHFVAVREGDTLTHYLNAEEKGTSNVGENPLAAATSKFRIGNWVLGSREWAGLIDEAFIFNRALQQDEVQSIMEGFAAALPVSPQGNAAVVWGDLKARK